jgi:hypothetical protein
MYQKTSSTGISNDGFYLTEGQSKTFTASAAASDWLSANIDDAILGIRATSTSTAGGSIKWADAEAVSGNIYTDDEIVGEGDNQYLVGDTLESIGDGAQGGDDLITGGGGGYNTIVGDAATSIIGTGKGGNDEIRSAENASSGIYTMSGDTWSLLDSARGGDDRILWTSGGYADISGDAFSMQGNAIGGNDQVRVNNLSGSFYVYGDSYDMSGSSRGGNDYLEGGTANGNGGTTTWYGDASEMYHNTTGGNDVIRGSSGSSLSDLTSTINIIFGDAYSADAGVTFGDDRLISGAYATDAMWGDAQFKDSGLGGADVFVFEANNGVDTIYDFEQNNDRIEIKGITGIATFDDLVVTTSLGANSSTINLGDGNTVTVLGVTNLTASDFIFT